MTKQANLPAFRHTIPLMLYVKQGSCKYQLLVLILFGLDKGIKLGSTDHEADALTTSPKPHAVKVSLTDGLVSVR